MYLIKIGTIFSHPDRRNICIRGYTRNGRYLVRQILLPIKHVDLLRDFDEEMIVPGALLRYPELTIQLIKLRDDGTWNNEADEITELGAAELRKWEPVNLQRPSRIFHGTEEFPLQRRQDAKQAGMKGGRANEMTS